MRRCVAVFFIVVLAVAALHAQQVPNQGFEAWTAGVPDDWFCTTSGIPGSLLQSSTAHSGSSAARGEVVSFSGFSVPPILSAGADGLGFPCDQRFATLTGYYQYTPVGGDMFIVTVGMLAGGQVIGAGAFSTTASQSTYAQFTVPIFYAEGINPDTCYVQIWIADSAGMTDAGSFYLVDDLSLSGTTDVGDDGGLPLEFSLRQNYPNPFNPATTISFSLASHGFVSLTVHDALGREVAVLASGEMPAGRHALEWNAAGFPSGVYFCRLRAGEFTGTTKLVLMR